MKPDQELLNIEQAFIKYLAANNSISVEQAKADYLMLKNKFDFSSKKYRSFCENVHSLHEVFYYKPKEIELIEAYKKLEFLHLFRHLSYAYPEVETYLMKIKNMFKTLIAPRIIKERPAELLLKLLTEQKEKEPVIVDYGAGLGHISLKIGQLFSNSKIYLIDIDTIVLRFAEFYFKEMHLDISTIKVDASNLYPMLPECNICICNEVLEHVNDPCLVFNNIVSSLQSGGLLYGDFENHVDEFLHVSTNLNDIRIELDNKFTKIIDCIYRKK